MKKVTMSLFAAALGATTLALNVSDTPSAASPTESSPSAMGFLINDTDRPVGWYSFPLTDATSLTKINETAAVSAGAMCAGTYYAQTYTSGGTLTPVSWNTLDITTGTLAKIVDCKEDSPLYVDMSYDYSEEKLWAIYHPGVMSSVICEVNLTDGSAIPYASYDNLWLSTIACSYDGLIYSLANDGCLYRFDKISRNFTKVGNTGKTIDYMQSMEFDHASGILYWAASNQWGGYFYSVDIANGNVTSISDLGNDGEMTGLYIPFKMAEEGAPAAVTGITLSNPAHDGMLEIAMTLPDKTADGTALKTLSGVVLESDGTEIKRWEGEEITPGASVNLTAEVAMGLHAFKVYAVNDAGAGVPRIVRSFIGEDVPAAPSNVTVEADGATNAIIKWSAVTTGAEGGWIDTETLSYEVVRNPGAEVVRSGIKETECADVIGQAGVYTYSVTATTAKGRSVAGNSQPTVLGGAVEVPYAFDFENENDLLMWTIVDGNSDGATWERSKTMDGLRTMLMRGTYNRVVDDWLFSPGIRLEAGKAYKIIYDAGCMNDYYPASYTVTIGKNASPDAQQVIKEYTTALRMLNKTYLYLPEITEEGTYYIGFHAAWESSVACLYISNFTLEENQASWITGTVTDGTSPIAGAKISFSENNNVCTTSDDGTFEIIEIVPGSYPLTVEKFGFEPFSETYTFAPLEHKQLQITMKSIPTASVSGRVVNAEGRGIENASVNVHGYDNYVAVTDKDGFFKVAGVYLKGAYTVDAHALNYEPSTKTLDEFDADTDMGTFTLQEKLIAPGNVEVNADRVNATVTWDAPQDVPASFRYDDGTDNYVFNMEMSAVSEYTAVGVIYDTPAVFTSVEWNVWNTANYGEPVDVLVFALDEEGRPTNRILYEENGLESENYNWHECVFKYPVIAPNGALFTLRGDARLCMDGGGENPAYPVMSDKMVMTHDYRTEAFTSRYTDNTPIFRGNLTLRANGLPYGAPRKSVAADAPEVTYDIWRLAPGQENDLSAWLKLNSVPLTITSFDDPTWESAVKGEHRFAIKANYKDGYSSYPVFSKEVPHLLHADVTLTFVTNADGEDASSAAVLLTGKDSTDSYSVSTDENGVASFSGVKEGTYVVTCIKKGFEAFEREIDIIGESDFESTFTLLETTRTPSNLIIEETDDPASRLLKWNVVAGLFDDFEGHEDFAVNSAGDIGWTYIDGDGVDTYFSPNYEYPNIGLPMAFMVMNPGKTVPSMLDENFLDCHSGDRCLLTYSLRNAEPNNDFIVSPKLDMGDDFVISFWARCYWWRYEETLRVGYSTDGQQPEDFIWVGDPVTVDYEDWRQITVNIPREARYVTINCVSKDNFYLAIDDIFIGAADKIPGLTENAPRKVAGVAVEYDVHLDGEKVASTSETQYLLENLSTGSHIAGVVARYASGDTEMATISFDIKHSGLDDIDIKALSVKVGTGSVTVTGADDGNVINVFRADGVLVTTAVSAAPETVLPLAPGVYVITVGDNPFPVMVR